MSTLNAYLLMGAALLIVIAFIYSFIAIWMGHRTGKWGFLIAIVLALFSDAYFLKISASSGLTMCIADINLLLSGILLAVTFFNFADIASSK